MNIAVVFPAASLALCVLFFLYLRWYLKRRTTAKELLAEYRAEVDLLNADINATADRALQLVEDRIKTLKALREDTDKRIAVYLRELDRSRSGEALYTSLGRGIRAALGTGTARAAGPVMTEQSAPPASPSPAEEKPAAAETETQPASKQQLRTQVAELAGQGLAAAEIASRLGVSLAEVDLALNLLPENFRRA